MSTDRGVNYGVVHILALERMAGIALRGSIPPTGAGPGSNVTIPYDCHTLLDSNKQSVLFMVYSLLGDMPTLGPNTQEHGRLFFKG